MASIAGPDIEDDRDNRAELEEVAREHDLSLDTVSTDTVESFGEAQAQIFGAGQYG